MIARKRPASETLLPLRAPKQARTTISHPLGGNSTPSQDEALLARWSKLSWEFMQVLRDTFVVFNPCECPAGSTPSVTKCALPANEGSPELVIMPSPPATPPPPPPPRASTSTRHLPPRPAIPSFPSDPPTHGSRPQLSTSAPAANGIHQRLQPHQNSSAAQARPILSKYANMQTNAVASTSKNTLASLDVPKVSGLHGDTRAAGLMSPPSTQASESSLRSAVTQKYPEVGAALAESAHRRKKSTKKYIEREHIHAKQHKARVEQEKKRTREEMEKDLKELYHIKRSAG
ncbi:hypothetical protein C8Q73DRAFT_605835, partial [Cubamyces lactineus]